MKTRKSAAQPKHSRSSAAPLQCRKASGEGVALIITLWVLLILSTMAAGFAYRMRLGIKMAGYQRDSFKALALAQAGVERAIAELKKLSEEGYTSLEQSWPEAKEMAL